MNKCILMGLLLITGKLCAQQIITDRPDQTEASSTVSKGSLQIESGILLGFNESNSEIERQILAPTTLFRYGLTKGIELRVLNQFESIKNQTNLKEINGISDLEIGTKIQLLRKEDINTEIAFLSHLIIPTGTKGLSNVNFGTINKLCISHELSEKSSIGYNIGYNYFGTGKGDLSYSLSFATGISEKLGIYIEPYGELTEFSDYKLNFDAGFTYLAKDNFQLDFSFGTGINNTMNYMSLGFSWNIKKE
ncbi:MAG: transporter [Flavobacteriales bacterium]|jgi:hypothetical protein|nr:transporter [Flavobacteriales bacterium]